MSDHASDRPNAEIMISTHLLRMVLDLPPSYQIVGAERGDQTDSVKLLVCADRLTAVADGEPRHLVTPIMRRVDAGQATLMRVDVVLSEDRARPIGPRIMVRE